MIIDIDPIAFSIGTFAIHWYGLAYIAGIVLAWMHMKHISAPYFEGIKKQDIDDFITYGLLGVLLGGRLGYVLFYNLTYYMHHPLEIFMPFENGDPFNGAFIGLRGMSFHGGALGVIIALLLFVWRRKINAFSFGDVVATGVPIGLLFGRIANFINGELWGRKTDLPWGFVFLGTDGDPRHPSQLYEAFAEGIVLFLLLLWMMRKTKAPEAKGFLAGTFLSGYGALRMAIEVVREPDAHIGYFWGMFTQGQLLCVPMILFGFYLMMRAKKS